MKYSDQLIDWLVDEGYTHCFFVAGGNIMHLLNSVRSRMTCVPFVNEVGAAIAAEYFTALGSEDGKKAFALVTAGPGLTNTVTAIASAWTESRELLVIGGQVKSGDLSLGQVRQRGIQEIDGLQLVQSITKSQLQIREPAYRSTVLKAIRAGASGRKGPVFLEVCLDAQAANHSEDTSDEINPAVPTELNSDKAALPQSLEDLVRGSQRPLLLLGGGVSRKYLRANLKRLTELKIPFQTTWNGCDLVPSDLEGYFGRPNTWGQRSANVIIQQADLVIAVGTRLGLQQTGFAWQSFAPHAKVIHVDIDPAELSKGHPRIDFPFAEDSSKFLEKLFKISWQDTSGWLSYCLAIKESLPLVEKVNSTNPGFVDPFRMMNEVARLASQDDVLVPCSSGGAFTVSMQALELRGDQRVVTNKGMASMGYGLSGAIGASLFNPSKRVWLFEGDGGFAQNLQELGTVSANRLNLKIFVFDNNGYASIRMTQRNYFEGAWVGCDASTGLGLPDWKYLAATYQIPFIEMDPNKRFDDVSLVEFLSAEGPGLVVVPIDPEQTYFPKISSRVTENGSMESNPLHLMDPPLPKEVSVKVFKYL